SEIKLQVFADQFVNSGRHFKSTVLKLTGVSLRIVLQRDPLERWNQRKGTHNHIVHPLFVDVYGNIDQVEQPQVSAEVLLLHFLGLQERVTGQVFVYGILQVRNPASPGNSDIVQVGIPSKPSLVGSGDTV